MRLPLGDLVLIYALFSLCLPVPSKQTLFFAKFFINSTDTIFMDHDYCSHIAYVATTRADTVLDKTKTWHATYGNTHATDHRHFAPKDNSDQPTNIRNLPNDVQLEAFATNMLAEENSQHCPEGWLSVRHFTAADKITLNQAILESNINAIQHGYDPTNILSQPANNTLITSFSEHPHASAQNQSPTSPVAKQRKRLTRKPNANAPDEEKKEYREWRDINNLACKKSRRKRANKEKEQEKTISKQSKTIRRLREILKRYKSKRGKRSEQPNGLHGTSNDSTPDGDSSSANEIILLCGYCYSWVPVSEYFEHIENEPGRRLSELTNVCKYDKSHIYRREEINNHEEHFCNRNATRMQRGANEYVLPIGQGQQRPPNCDIRQHEPRNRT